MEPVMLAQLRAAIVSLLALTVIVGIAYPLLVTGIAQAAFPSHADGSLIVKDGKPVGSRLIGQSFDEPKYFWGRLSATSDANGKPLAYNGAASTGSNLGPTNPALVDEVKGGGRLPGAPGRQGARTRREPCACARGRTYRRQAIADFRRAARQRPGAEPGARFAEVAQCPRSLKLRSISENHHED
jgi:hypothetical protein